MLNRPEPLQNNALAFISAQKAALVTALQNNPVLGDSFKNSYQSAQGIYAIEPKDTAWVCQIKSLINAINQIEKIPHVLTGLLKYIDAEKGTLSMLATLANNKTAMSNVAYHMKAFEYYTKQSGDNLLTLMPHLQTLQHDFTSLIKNFNPIYQIIFPTAKAIQNLEEKDENIFDRIQHALIENIPRTPEQKDQIKSDLIQWYHATAATQINYGLTLSVTDNKLQKLAEPLFGKEYQLWQLASIEAHLEKNQNTETKIQIIKTMLAEEKLDFKTPITILYEINKELKDIKSYEIHCLVNTINQSIQLRTNATALDKAIHKLEGKITINSAEKKNYSPTIQENQLQKLYDLREELQKHMLEVKTGKSSVIHHYDAKHNLIMRGEALLTSTKPLVDKKSPLRKNADTALDRVQVNNRNQKQQLIEARNALKRDPALANASEERLNEIKAAIQSGESQKAKQTLRKSEIKEKLQTFQAEHFPKQGTLHEKLAMTSLKPITEKIKEQIQTLTTHLSTEAKYRLFSTEKQNVSELKEIYNVDKPLVKLIKLTVTGLDLLEKNLHNMQIMQASAKISSSSAAKHFLGKNTISDLRALRATMNQLNAVFAEFKSLLSQHNESQILNLPLLNKLENTIKPLITLYQQIDVNRTFNAVMESSTLKNISAEWQKTLADEKGINSVKLVSDIGDLILHLNHAKDNNSALDVAQAIAKVRSIANDFSSSHVDNAALETQINSTLTALSQELEKQSGIAVTSFEKLAEELHTDLKESVISTLELGTSALGQDLSSLHSFEQELGINVLGEEKQEPDLNGDLSVAVDARNESLSERIISMCEVKSSRIIEDLRREPEPAPPEQHMGLELK